MAKQKVFFENGEAKQFYKVGYSEAIINMAQKKGQLISETEAFVSEKINRNIATVHGWRCDSIGGPGDIEMVKELGVLLCNNPDAFLISYSEEKTMTKLTERQLSAFKRVYDEVLCFFRDYYTTNGFWMVLQEEKKKEMGSLSDSATDEDIIFAINSGEATGRNKVEERWDRMLFILRQEYFDLHGTEVFHELWQLIQEMNETWIDISPIETFVEAEGQVSAIRNYDRINNYEKTLKLLVDKYN